MESRPGPWPRPALSILAAALLFGAAASAGPAAPARTPSDFYSALAKTATWHRLPAPYRLLRLVAHRQRSSQELFVGAIAILVGGGGPQDGITLAVAKTSFAAHAALTTWIAKDHARRVDAQNVFAWTGTQKGPSQDCDPPLPVCYATELLTQQGTVMVAVLSPDSHPASALVHARLATLLHSVVAQVRRLEG